MESNETLWASDAFIKAVKYHPLAFEVQMLKRARACPAPVRHTGGWALWCRAVVLSETLAQKLCILTQVLLDWESTDGTLAEFSIANIMA